MGGGEGGGVIQAPDLSVHQLFQEFLLVVKGELLASFDWVSCHPGLPRSPPAIRN